eukprot:TRINITY_DN2694_c0_g1_i32.p1 TRINITY_DN2694_c0_g1~~TRINITY_DN2694_c0_g1_i32.p1  ORF type:complete len:259 (+),score=32.54 TRINITY_DN2694_c0_g1_i32:132-908(+)
MLRSLVGSEMCIRDRCCWFSSGHCHVGPASVAGRQGASAAPTAAFGASAFSTLVADDTWTRVTTVGRRPMGHAHPKVTELVAQDMKRFQDMKAALDGQPRYDVVFICIGTTRAAAGGAIGFRDVEVGITTAVAKWAVDSGVRHASVVSAQGANHRQWAVDWIHPLLYVRTLGEKEQAVLGAGFPRVTIFRPGMLNRLVGDRWHENLINRLGLGLSVDVLAAAMIRDAEGGPPSPSDEGARETPVFFEGNRIIEQSSKL